VQYREYSCYLGVILPFYMVLVLFRAIFRNSCIGHWSFPIKTVIVLYLGYLVPFRCIYEYLVLFDANWDVFGI
jgi:hypothetical protein